jgi:23S rRNA pseudouridine1911/1915/1917 synthase
MRLDVCIQKHLKTPRNQIEQLIKKHGVFVDDKEVFKSGLKLKGGETIEFELPTPQKETLCDIDFQRDSTDARFDIDIIYEDDDLLIINKPPHLIVHPAASVKEPTLVDWLKHKGISLSTLSGEERHGIVHRIDKETSGALVIAKNNETHNALSKQLEDKSMGRYYLSLIDLPLKENIIVQKPIARSSSNRTKMAIDPNGRDAKSAFLKIAASKRGDIELIACKLFTGRTHQIRVHLESLSRHILNDFTYGFKNKKAKDSRVMLHAYIIYFIHPKSKKLIVKKAPLFEDFKGILQKHFNAEAIDEKTDPNTIISSFNTSF